MHHRALHLLAPLALAALLAACGSPDSPREPDVTPAGPAAVSATANAVATFAGGCFWCMEPPFDRLPGVVATTSGFTGGTTPDPTYSDVSTGRTDHVEAVEVRYDSTLTSYQQLLDVFWQNIDPLDDGGQFCDRGDHYRAAIFTHHAGQQRLAEASRQRVQARFRQPVVTTIRPAGAFYAAPEEHQDFYRKQPEHYRRYRQACGRDARLAELWGR
jgi:peptide-methionine (S)-S-oxide reductase